MRMSAYRRKIERLYIDTCDIYGHEKIKNKEMNTTVMDNVPKDGNVQCRISQKALGTNNQSSSSNQISYETKLFINPDIRISQGDRLKVTRNGITRKYTAGEPIIYPTHQEISIQRKEWA